MHVAALPEEHPMKVGTDVSVLAEPGRPDAAVLADHLMLADLAEPLGFDSLFGLEHHFTGYSMSPSPLQLLSYYAGRTRSEEHTSELQSLMRISYAVFCLKKKKT